MSAPAGGRYAFGLYVLDIAEQSLHRDGRVVRLPPRAFDTLCILVQRHGHLVTKEALLNEVWRETVVEDNNLTQQISILRRTLNGDGVDVRIETVPKRGYRFVGTVELVSDGRTAPAMARVEGPKVRPRTPRRIGWLLGTLVAGVAGAAAVWGPHIRQRLTSAAPDLTPRLSRVTNLGTVVRAAISQDGRSLVYAVSAGSRESLWLRTDAENPVQLIEPAVGTFSRGGMTLAPDGWVYYSWFQPDLALVGIFRVRPEGGRPERVRNIWDQPSFDPAGVRYACINSSRAIRESRLVVYDAAGAPPRVVATRAPPETFLPMRPAWSPDGRQLAAWTMSERTPGVRELVIFDVDDGQQRVVTTQALYQVEGMAWLPDGASVIVAARVKASSPLRLWQIPLAAPVMRPLTRDISDYLLAGMTGDGTRLAAVRVDVARSVWVAPATDVARARQVGSDAGELAGLESVAWMPDGRLLYTSAESGNADIWVLDTSHGTRRQLTTNSGDDFNPASSPDGRTIVFASDRSGPTGIWAMSDAGEGSVRQLTNGGDSRPSVSTGGWVVFQRGVIHSSPIALWRVPLDGGAAVQLTDGTSIRPVVSPDGRLVAHYWQTPERWALTVVPIAGGQPLQVFPLTSTHCERTVRWSPDSRALAYIDCLGGVANVWLLPLDGGAARQLTDFTSGHIDTFDWSRDGSQLAWIRRSDVSDVVLIDLPRP